MDQRGPFYEDKYSLSSDGRPHADMIYKANADRDFTHCDPAVNRVP